MPIKILLLLSIAIQTIATIYSLRLIRETKYNIIWVLFIVGFTVLSAERYMQLISLNGGEVPTSTFIWTGFIVSIGLSVGVFYSHKLVKHIDRLTRQQQLVSRRILASTLRAEESSRSKISKEIHDGLGPLLSAAKMSLSALEDDVSEPDKAKIIATTTTLIDEAVRSLREISNNLSPQLLSDFGLSRAVGNFVTKCGASATMEINFKSEIAAQRYDSDTEVVLYRVLCELINNSIKHSAATSVGIFLNERPGAIFARYSDNGVGFDLQRMESRGQGLSNISSRINSLNGTLEFVTSPGSGVRVEIDIPIDDE